MRNKEGSQVVKYLVGNEKVIGIWIKALDNVEYFNGRNARRSKELEEIKQRDISVELLEMELSQK